MIQILIVSPRKTFSDTLLSVFLKDGEIDCSVAESGEQGIRMIKDRAWHLVVTDEKLADMTGIELIETVVSINPLINCVAASSLSQGDFHEASEGLGVLMSIPLDPEKEHGRNLLGKLRVILNITAGP